ncbi:hypothetical protein QPL79_03810 [Ignisphaera sp. 4213-co]|uniref:Neutral/alkaline non-lysosomal ceramidase N-terminal domain-containing protein n=1 Tax=Ignisphaera cupida TaxID=3050454 RepID=A0ABD4Z585_9CREN|nr:hypothetical protein [Ignisphaera sp. 4213-co]MDK6028481.1 hypothetical protein [Ignisphaera sp. 4213-co]
MEIGYAKTAVNPPIGIKLEGYANRLEPSKCIYDDLYSRCLSLKVKDTTVSIVVVDSIGIPYSLYTKVLKRSSAFGVDVLLGATHSHSTPSPFEDPLYEEYLVRSIVGCINASLNNMNNIQHFVVGKSFLPQLIYNRRKPLEGVVDPEIIAVDSKLITIVNFTSHPVVLGPNNLCISSDYPGAAIRWLENITNKNAMFLNGCCGNINPYTASTNINKPYDRSGGSYEEVKQYGEVLALEALKSIRLGERIDLEKCDELSYKKSVIRLRLRKEVMETISSLRKANIESMIVEAEKQGNVYELWKLKLVKAFLREISEEDLPVPIAVINLCNKLAFVFLPAEVFVEHQLYIKNKSPFKYTIVTCYFNSYWMYIPTKEAFSEGGYEVEPYISIIEAGEGEKLRDEVVKMLQEVYTG